MDTKSDIQNCGGCGLLNPRNDCTILDDYAESICQDGQCARELMLSCQREKDTYETPVVEQRDAPSVGYLVHKAVFSSLPGSTPIPDHMHTL